MTQQQQQRQHKSNVLSQDDAMNVIYLLKSFFFFFSIREAWLLSDKPASHLHPPVIHHLLALPAAQP